MKRAISKGLLPKEREFINLCILIPKSLSFVLINEKSMHRLFFYKSLYFTGLWIEKKGSLNNRKIKYWFMNSHIGLKPILLVVVSWS